jgi:hypothetical protein
MTAIAILPVDVSADSKRNAHCFDCHLVEQRMHYVVCLDRIKKEKSDNLSRSLAVCSRAIGRGDCPAVIMQKEEIAKGQAIYFVDRNAPGVVSAIIEKAKNVFNRILPAKPEASVMDKIDTTDYAAAINYAMTNKVPVITATQKAIQPTALANETPLQIARRLASKS